MPPMRLPESTATGVDRTATPFRSEIATWPLPADPRLRTRSSPSAGPPTGGPIPMASVLARLSAVALHADGPGDVFPLAAEAVTALLGADFVTLWQLLPGGQELLLVHQSGWPPSAVSGGSARVVVEEGTVSALVLTAGVPVVVDDVRSDARFVPTPGGRSLGRSPGNLSVVGGVTVLVEAGGQPWGTLGAHLLEPRPFSDGEVDVMQMVANLVATAIEREQAGRRRLQTERQRRLSDLGRTTTGVAHDLDNVLAGIDATVSVLEIETRDGSPETHASLLRRLHEEVAAGHCIVRQVLESAMATSPVHAEIDMCALARSIPDRLGLLVGPEAHISVSCPEEPLVVRGDEGRFHQVLTNLVMNAVDAMGGEGEVKIELASAAGSWVCLAVRDAGTGIPPELLDKVFEPFFTTKAHCSGTGAVRRGAGLGLAQVRGLVEQHRGHLTLESRLGVGTTATVWLPFSGKG